MPDRDRFFRSFDEAWSDFQTRERDLLDAFALFPEQERLVLAWLLLPDPELVARALELQRAFAHLDWITPLPAHFLHVSVAFPGGTAAEEELARGRDACVGVAPFEVDLRRVGCFHDAVIVEVHGDGPRELAARLDEDRDLSTYLPHLTLGFFNDAHDPAPLREALVPLRDVDLGRRRFDAVTLCVVPASRTTILTPWRVAGRVEF